MNKWSIFILGILWIGLTTTSVASADVYDVGAKSYGGRTTLSKGGTTCAPTADREQSTDCRAQIVMASTTMPSTGITILHAENVMSLRNFDIVNSGANRKTAYLYCGSLNTPPFNTNTATTSTGTIPMAPSVLMSQNGSPSAFMVDLQGEFNGRLPCRGDLIARYDNETKSFSTSSIDVFFSVVYTEGIATSSIPLSTQDAGNLSFALSIIIVIASLIFIGFIMNSITKKKR